MRDPSRHTIQFLKEFCDSYGLSDEGAGGGSNLGGIYGCEGSGRNDGMEKQALVDRIKNFQRQGTQNKEAWYAFCGEMKDPSRHDVQFLKDFVFTAGVP